MFQQAPIPDLSRFRNRVGNSPRSMNSAIAVGDLTALRRFLSDELDEPARPYGAPLHLAIYLENEEPVDVLLQAGADTLKEPEIFDLYCLVDAAQYGEITTLGDVLRWGQNNWSSESRSRALSAAADNWHVENLEFLLSEKIPFETEALNVALAQITFIKPCFERRDQTQAEIAAQSQSIKVLMAAGADPSKPGPSGICMGEPLLIWTAVCRQSHNCLKALLDNGADPNITNSQGQTALYYLGALVKRDPTFRRRMEVNEPTEDVFHTLLAFNASPSARPTWKQSYALCRIRITN
ncbi:unnamed protein product [Fusarium venenatum]|uniref:Uncharacterized protein n=1 Tax=Fusarium venenatum TaxID=56646 RepID=A0A2L2TKV1_9HYPO|nr:uncharacterized protein FVRRES_13758 [Fusarium venenatum]CEI41820.1 unnamed protein product [Fusarium venenatum]